MFGSTAKHLRTYYFQKGQLEQSILRHHTGRELIVVPPLCLHHIKSNSCSAQNRKIGRLISNEARSIFGLPRIRNILNKSWQKFRCCLSFFCIGSKLDQPVFSRKIPEHYFFPKKLAPKNCFQSKVVEAEVCFQKMKFLTIKRDMAVRSDVIVVVVTVVADDLSPCDENPAC